LVLLIYVATVFLRYHYVVDLIAGTLIALAAIPLGHWAVLRWARRRSAAGLAALPALAVDPRHAGSLPRPAEGPTMLPEN
jgi:membrane-associated phospholipid phosphatase